MNRLHVHLHVNDIAQSVRFYSALFGAEPAKREPDYAKWMLDDPRVNFAISRRGEQRGVDHLGLQVDDRSELREISDRLDSAGRELYDRGEAHCCYARSDKAWVRDPQGVSWETFFTFGQETAYGEGMAAQGASASACCGESACGSAEPEPAKKTVTACCAA